MLRRSVSLLAPFRRHSSVSIMNSNRVVVNVREGKLIGIIDENIQGGNYITFRGIPYAKPPVGKLRFKDPAPPEPWSGSRDSSKHGNVAVQKDLTTREMIGDEDCLYLNVYTVDIESWRKRPVMVWIHGGGFSIGSGDAFIYGPDYIVRKDVVLVTLNYRLGVLGFLNLNDEVATGNQGMKDVVMALRWVQKNISKFTGDPENVTIFGESAGGAIVHYLTLSPLSEGLFHKAISQSGVAANPWAFNEWTNKAMNKGFQLAEYLGRATSDPKVAYEFLKTIDARKLREAEQKLLTKTECLQHVIAFTPSLDHESPNPFFSEHPSTLIRRQVKVPYILGCNSCEGSYFACSNLIRRLNKETFKELDSDFKKTILPRVLSTLPQIPITIEELRFLYFGNKTVSEEALINYADFLGDVLFYRGIMEIADTQMSSDTNEPTYLYIFSYESETSPWKKFLNITLPGVTHSEELFYLFYPYMIKYLGFSTLASDSKDYKIMNRLTQMWTDFAKTGNPTPVITNLTPIKWTPLKHGGNVYDYLNINIEPGMKTFRKGEQRWDWKNMKHKL
ncbi:juvenile hormone esterase-like isoform X2 [Polyergus mexicanus]|uniref:juvenile hormone esterase-like isoform X2 n=1 Tax=Polyergus mexicanus TaxID=615972 RepID=UPI0038B6A6F0